MPQNTLGTIHLEPPLAAVGRVLRQGQLAQEAGDFPQKKPQRGPHREPAALERLVSQVLGRGRLTAAGRACKPPSEAPRWAGQDGGRVTGPRLGPLSSLLGS